VVPLGAVADRPDYEFANGVTLHVFALEPGAALDVTVPGLDGSPAAMFSVARDGDVLTASLVDGAAPGWSVVVDSVQDVARGTAESDQRGTRLRPDGDRLVARMPTDH